RDIRLLRGHDRRIVRRMRVEDRRSLAGEGRPLVEQARVHLPYELAEPLDEVAEFLGLRLVGDRLTHGPVGVTQVAQYEPLAAPELVEGDVIGEGHRTFEEVAHD